MMELKKVIILGFVILVFLLCSMLFAALLFQQEDVCPTCKNPPRKVDGGGYEGPFRSPRGDKTSWVNGRVHEGEVTTADYPGTLYMKNIGSHKDGAGMCVMTSITMCAKYVGLREYYGLRDWCANEPGGAYRQKVDDQIKRYEQAMGITHPAPYIQYEGPNPEALLEEIDKARLPYAHTYGYSPRYGHRIAHMVMGVKYNGKYAIVVDNNPMQDLHPESNEFHEWMSKEEDVHRMKYGSQNAWVFAWLAAPPPPCPAIN